MMDAGLVWLGVVFGVGGRRFLHGAFFRGRFVWFGLVWSLGREGGLASFFVWLVVLGV